MLKLAVPALGLAFVPLFGPYGRPQETGAPVADQVEARAPGADEVNLTVVQYATGAHALDVRCDGSAPRVLDLAVSTPVRILLMLPGALMILSTTSRRS